MPDGLAREIDLGFDRLTPAGIAAFRGQCAGELRARLDMLGTDFAVGDDGWLYRRDGVIRGIGALSQLMPWHWVLWSFPHDLNLGDWKRVMRFTRLRIARKFADPRVMRISATARCDVPGAASLLERLGFDVEGVLRCYGPGGEAHWQYAFVRPPATEGGNVGI